MSETVDLPWVDEPVELAEAVEMIARADEEDEDVIEDVSARVDKLQRRIERLEDGSDAECPSCGSADDVYKSGIGAAKLASKGALSEKNATALNRESHVCLDCRESFTPSPD
ncbi:hypothetical protein HWV07_16615 [Natronomonas salina]|uniref:hypothetical protein n=1 Tax=Natronomonas salina TaxID=1710540 RepID=UPI0015B57487|nr:hypothetical protein [Natronomonas salina]QLD90569.1 hypothetical protein HWV07_16615 [Natronomonas salina]